MCWHSQIYSNKLKKGPIAHLESQGGGCVLKVQAIFML